MKYLLISILAVSMTVQASEPSVVFLPKGTAAPFDGYIFTPEKEKDLRLLDENYNLCNNKVTLLEKQALLQNDLLNISTTRADLYQKQSDALASEAVSAKSDNFWRSALFFIAGAAVTGLVAYGAARAVR